MHDEPGISREQLQACLQEQYDLIPDTFDFLPLGLDNRAGVYHVVSTQGLHYLLKVKSGPLYEPAYLVPRYLFDQGIATVVAPLLTRSKTLWTRIGDWIVVVYPFLNGDTNWTGMTEKHWEEVGTTFKRIHQFPLPANGFESLRKETFDPTEYVRWVHTFESQYTHSEDGESSQRALRAAWLANQPVIHAVVASLEKLADVLQKYSGPYVICHADLHPANLLREPTGQVFVIDWDEVMLAPKERDFIFLRETPANDQALQDSSSFFQAYGSTEIDWIALAYYRYERVIQDLIACGEEVFLRDDLGETTKADAVQLFHDILSESGEIAAAYAAEAHLSSDQRHKI